MNTNSKTLSDAGAVNPTIASALATSAPDSAFVPRRDFQPGRTESASTSQASPPCGDVFAASQRGGANNGAPSLSHNPTTARRFDIPAPSGNLATEPFVALTGDCSEGGASLRRELGRQADSLTQPFHGAASRAEDSGPHKLAERPDQSPTINSASGPDDRLGAFLRAEMPCVCPRCHKAIAVGENFVCENGRRRHADCGCGWTDTLIARDFERRFVVRPKVAKGSGYGTV